MNIVPPIIIFINLLISFPFLFPFPFLFNFLFLFCFVFFFSLLIKQLFFSHKMVKVTRLLCLFVCLTCFLSQNFGVIIHNLVSFLRFPKGLHFFHLLLFQHNFKFHFEFYFAFCFFMPLVLLLIYSNRFYQLPVASEQNVFLPPQLSFFLMEFFSSSLGCYRELTPGCLETFCILSSPCLYFYVIY